MQKIIVELLRHIKRLRVCAYFEYKRVMRYGKEITVYSGFNIFHGGKNISLGSNLCLADSCLNAGDGEGSITIEDNCFFGHKVMILARSHDYRLKGKLRMETITEKPIIIRQGVWIASGSIILQGVEIGENSVIGAGSVVTKDVMANTIYCDRPTKFIERIDW